MASVRNAPPVSADTSSAHGITIAETIINPNRGRIPEIHVLWVSIKLMAVSNKIAGAMGPLTNMPSPHAPHMSAAHRPDT